MNVNIDMVITTLRRATAEWRKPVVTEIAQQNRDPYKVLISTIISLRTKDEVTREASGRLFARVHTQEEMVTITAGEIAKLIYPAGFYRTKAETILEVSRDILERFNGQVPDTLDDLLTLKGVGRKTANLVLTHGFGLPGICVDTHVHRITNRLGYVSTRNPIETEFALRKKLPRQYWIEYNDLMVALGQHICKPISPLCSRCPIHDQCNRVGVIIHR